MRFHFARVVRFSERINSTSGCYYYYYALCCQGPALHNPTPPQPESQTHVRQPEFGPTCAPASQSCRPSFSPSLSLSLSLCLSCIPPHRSRRAPGLMISLARRRALTRGLWLSDARRMRFSVRPGCWVVGSSRRDVRPSERDVRNVRARHAPVCMYVSVCVRTDGRERERDRERASTWVPAPLVGMFLISANLLTVRPHHRGVDGLVPAACSVAWRHVSIASVKRADSVVCVLSGMHYSAQLYPHASKH
jgi:hypothetical protein